MNASDPRWSRLNIVGKAGLIGIGPFVSIGLFSMGAALPRMANGFAGAPNVDLLDLLIGSVVAPSCRRLTRTSAAPHRKITHDRPPFRR